MVGRGASLDNRLFLGGTDGSNPVLSSGSPLRTQGTTTWRRIMAAGDRAFEHDTSRPSALIGTRRCRQERDPWRRPRERRPRTRAAAALAWRNSDNINIVSSPACAAATSQTAIHLKSLFEAGLAQPVQKVINVSRIGPIPPEHAGGIFEVRVHSLELGKRRPRLLDLAKLGQPCDDIA